MAVLGALCGGHGPERNIAIKASAASRLLRTYATQLEALRRLRNGGSQPITSFNRALEAKFLAPSTVEKSWQTVTSLGSSMD